MMKDILSHQDEKEKAGKGIIKDFFEEQKR